MAIIDDIAFASESGCVVNNSKSVLELAAAAKASAPVVAALTATERCRALKMMAAAIRSHSRQILVENTKDMDAARGAGVSASMQDRLLLTVQRIEDIARGVDAVSNIDDPVGRVQGEWSRPNGLTIKRVSVPLGVIGVIYESRPNVTADAAALCLRAGNACFLRGGSESFHTSLAIFQALQQGLQSAGLPEGAIQMVRTTDRAAVGEMLRADEFIDVIIPRGGKGLVARVREESRIPVFAHLDGNNHVFVHASADAEKASRVVLNAKMRRTSICGAAETLLVDRESPLLASLVKMLLDAGCDVRGDAATMAVDPRVIPAVDADWATEYLDAVIAVKQVEGLDEAMAHIARYGSHHTDAILAEDPAAVASFSKGVDSAIVMVNTSTQFADGGEFGFGAEIGIATGRLHARGPVGAAQLTTFKYVVTSEGAVRR